MNTDDFFRELTRSPAHASLSGGDLSDLAKRASDMFLCQDTPLTEAVVKVACEHPGISQEQVKRVVEMCNTETFQRLFEKQASGDKQVDFVIADPGEVLRQMDSGAQAPIMKVASADYASAPPVHRSKDVEADLTLCGIFGVTPGPTSAMKKTAMMDPARGQAALELFAQKEQAAKAQKKVIETLMQPPPVSPPPSPEQLGIEGMTPQGPGGPAPQMPQMPKMAEIGGMGGMSPGGGVPGSPTPGGGVPGATGGGAGGAGDAAPPIMDEGGVIPGMPGDRQLIDAIPGEIVLNPEAEGLTSEQIFEAIAEKKEEVGGEEQAFQAVAAPEEEEEPKDDGDQMKEAMAYFKTDRPDAGLVGQDLQSYVSVDAIKTAARRNDQQYREAVPFGDLVRTRQMLEKQASDLNDAIEENHDHWKVATAELGHNVLQHILSGGNLGEVVHLMGGFGTQNQVKVAMENIMPALEHRLPPWQFTELQAGLIEYEMEKGASARAANPDHPIAKSFGGVLKLSNDHDVLKHAQAKTDPLLAEATQLVQKASMTRVKA